MNRKVVARTGMLVFAVMVGIFVEAHSIMEKACEPEAGSFWNQKCFPTWSDYYIPEISGWDCPGDRFPCRYRYLDGWIKCAPRSLMNTQQGCTTGENIERIVLPCRKDEFACSKSGLCLPRYAVLDGENDCVSTDVKNDTSDEDATPYKCFKLEFQCRNSGRCIPREWVMDDFNDCPSGNDEEAPLSYCYPDEEFRCKKSGRCLKRHRVMDGSHDCRRRDFEDHSDENRTNVLSCQNSSEFRCANSGRCIPRMWKFRYWECTVDSDEGQETSACKDDEFRCLHTHRCISNKYLCDGMDHCKDCSDEIEACPEPRMWTCPGEANLGNRTCIPQSYGCDDYQDCPGGSDNPHFLPGLKCAAAAAREITNCNIPQWTLTDSHAICQNREDICYANDSKFQCEWCADRKTIIGGHQVCDGVVDCRDLWDECLCEKHRKNTTGVGYLCGSICYGEDSEICKICSLGEVYCETDNKCINRSLLCDGKFDCPRAHLDEMFCGSNLTSGDASLGDETFNFTCWPFHPDVATIIENKKHYNYLLEYITKSAKKCDGIVECARFEDECNSSCLNELSVCADFPLKNVSDPRIPGVELQLRFCNEENHTLGGKSFCNGIRECNDGADELESMCTGRHYCDAGYESYGIERKQIVSIDKSKVCDQIPDCKDRSDENCERKSFDPFSSALEMIKNKVLRFFLWFMAVFAIVGNTCVILETYFLDNTSGSVQFSTMSTCNKRLIINLALADLLMGIALMCIGVQSSLMSGKYLAGEKEWRTSIKCSGIGALIVISSETSVFTLVVLTFYRLYGVCRPFASRNLAPKKVFYAVVASWLLSLFLALLPIIPRINHSFLSDVYISPSVYFTTTTVSFDDFRNFATHAFVLNGSEHLPGEFTEWQYMAERLTSSFPEYTPEIKGYFGYYSSHGVCMPRLFKTEGTPPIHPLSMCVISVNFVSMVFIIIAYSFIYRKSATRGRVAGGANAHENNNRSMQRKITILIATDVSCWLPICVMAFLSQFVPIPPTVYAVSVIILLPINSSMNPLIYSNGFQLTRELVMKKRRNLRGEEVQRNAQNVNEQMGRIQRIANIEMQEINGES